MKEIEIVVRGGVGSGAYSAAQAIARVLEEEGASVDLQTMLAAEELARGVLSGTRALVRVESPATSTLGVRDRAAASALVRPADSGSSHGPFGKGVKVAIGIVLLLMLFSGELRLRFGLRFDSIITLGAIWVFWHYALRARPGTA